MVMQLDSPVVLSEAETFKIPLASISKLTSTWDTMEDLKQLKLAEKAVVLGVSTFSFVYLNKDTVLVVKIEKISYFWWERWCYI
jgi:hypothetical protein